MSELTVLRDVLVVRENGNHVPVGLVTEVDPDTGKALVDYPGKGWHAVDGWTLADPGAVDAARSEAAAMSRLEATVLDAYVIAAGDGLTNDALDAHLEQAGVADFDRSIALKIRAAHLTRGWIEVLPVPARSRRQRREPAHVRRITGHGRLVHVERRLALATAVSS